MTSEQRTRIALNAAIVARAALDITDTQNTRVMKVQLLHMLRCAQNLEGAINEAAASEKKGQQ